jgi:DHA2 family multidrug resistance protein
LSPGGLAIIVLIPVVGVLMRFIQTRLLIAAGFFMMGCAFLYSSRLSPSIDFATLVSMRAAQTVGLAFLFVPISTIAYTTLPRRLNGDATALFSMFRNVFGSIGISLSSAMITERTQVHQASLAKWATPFREPFNQMVATYERALVAMGHAAGAAHDGAVGMVYQSYRKQAQILGYSDVFLYVAVVSFCVVPFCLFLTNKKAARGPAAAH